LEALSERAYLMTSLGEDILKTIDEKEKNGSKSLVAPVKPRSRRAGGRGPPTSDLQTHSAEEGPPADDSTRPPVPLPDETRPKGKDTAGVPTTLEGLFSTGEEKSAHEVLGLLVDSHIKEAEAILGRTNLKSEDILPIARALHRARHGIGGGPGSPFDRPKPWISQFTLDILRALPSVGGLSRTQFVEAWQSAQERLRREQESKEGAQERLVRA
jgi:hypothetical protein